MLPIVKEVASGPEPTVSELMEVPTHFGFERRLMEFVETVCEEAVFTIETETDLCETFAEFELALGGVLV